MVAVDILVVAADKLVVAADMLVVVLDMLVAAVVDVAPDILVAALVVDLANHQAKI